jgi:hypothetical protein
VRRLPRRPQLAVAQAEVLRHLPRQGADEARGPDGLSRLSPHARVRARGRYRLRELSREADAGRDPRRRSSAQSRPHEMYRLPHAPQVRCHRGQVMHELPPESAGARVDEAHAMYRLSLAT